MKRNFTLLLLFCSYIFCAQVTVFPTSSPWKYLDNGTNQGTAWYSTTFNDASWASGNAQLGYGEADEATVLSYGPSSGNKYITHYFRKTFSVASGTFTSFSLNYKVDDGMVVYVNGAEAFRVNMPGGTVTYTTLANGSPDDGQTTLTTTVSASTFSIGTNIIAVEVHQNAANSSDETFEMNLIANPLVTGPPMVALNATLFPLTSTWKYLDDGSDQGTGWYASGFNDLAWPTGTAQFGFGENDETTLLNACGAVVANPSCGNKYITHYFRKTISISSVTGYTAYTFNYKRDDGVIVYVNDVEAFRDNMPLGATNYTTLAASNASDDGQTIITMTVPAVTFSAGTNVIAVELHNRDGSSSDATFEMELLANTNTLVAVAPSIVKGPYLQIGTQNSMIVRWETNIATDSKVMYGLNAASLTSVQINTVSSTVHTVQLSGLTPYTKYFYSIGTGTIVTQGDTNNYFLTSPVPGTPGKYRFWMVGDCGNASTNQTNCKNQFKTYNGNNIVNGMLLSGDNAYSSGTHSEFNSRFFAIYQNDVLKNMPLWPAPGNHDYNNGASTATTVPYFSIFTTPTNAEAGGVASNNPAYYSYDYGNIHFLSLDSYGRVGSEKMYDTTGAQTLWIKADLAANTKKWVIAYWHHPPYTMGSHNSDTEGDLVAIHTRFIKILERYGVDMIITGHSHDYERSKLMNGHYGNEASFSAATHNLSSSSGSYDGSINSCPYTKDSVVNKIGTVYVVSGSAGQLGGAQGAFPHNAMHYSNATNGGTFILDIEDNKLDAKWLCADGVIRDKFTMFKDVKANSSYTVLPGQTQTLSASWPGSYVWGNAATTRTLSASALSDSTIWVKDPNNCVADTFKLRVLPAVNFTATLPYCSATPVQFNDLSTNNTSNWNWSVNPSAGVTINSPNSQNPNITFANAGTYTVTLISENAYGPGIAFSRTLAVNSLPSVSSTLNPTVICANGSATVSASGAVSYSWSSGQATNSITVSAAANATYIVTGTDANGCQNTSVKSLLVNPLPAVTIVANPTTAVICSGSSITLSGAGANNYSWLGGITNGNPFTLSANATYTLTGTDGNGCQNTVIKTVTVNPLPVLTITSNPSGATVCQGSALVLTAGGASSYAWTGSITNGSSFTPSSGSVYTVTGTDANGCQNILTQSVTVNALPVISINANAAICSGQTATLTANGGSSYSWNTSFTTTAIAVNPSGNTSYTVTGTDANGCQNTAIKTVTVNALPSVSVISNPVSAIVCSGSTIALNGTGASTYTWTSGITNGVAFVLTSNSTYTVTGTDVNNCANTAVASVVVNALPLVTISGNATVCAGETATLLANGASTYSWTNGNATASFTAAPTAGTNYTVTGTDANGCKNTAVTNFQIKPLPNVSASSNSNMLCTGQSATLTASGANTFTWTSNGTGTSLVVSPAVTTTYTVTGTGSNSCTAIATVVQNVSGCTGLESLSLNEKVAVYPNPNKGSFIIELKGRNNLKTEIYNTLGQRVYSANLEQGDNSINLNVNKGIYFYVILDDKKITESGKIIIE